MRPVITVGGLYARNTGLQSRKMDDGKAVARPDLQFLDLNI